MEFVLNDYHRNVSDEDLLKDILRVANQLGKTTLTRTEYRDNGGKYHYSTIVKRFGGWLKALQFCGLTPSKKQIDTSLAIFTQSYIATEELIEDLKIVSNRLNKKSISSHEYNQNGKFSSATFFNRFHTWNNALIAADLIPFQVVSGKRVNEYDVIKEIERIWITLGRQPTATDIKNGISKYSLHVFVRRFGSWRKALEFFVAYMNGEQDIEQPTEEEQIQLPITVSKIPDKNEPTHKTNRDIGIRLRFMVMKRDNFKCCICGRSPATNPGLELHIDHITPWSKGGETVIDNLQTLCSDCNLGKGNISEDD